MKTNASIHILAILMVAVFFITGPVVAAPPKPATQAATIKAKTVTSEPDVMQKVGPNDSVVILSGKIDMMGADYYMVVPQVNYYEYKGNVPLEPMDSCHQWPIDYYLVPQMKAVESSGYKYIFVYRNTKGNEECWKRFIEFTAVKIRLMSERVMVFKTEDDNNPAVWPITSYSSVNGKFFTPGPVQPK